jgi:plasmid stabilization system protein ParE
MKVVVTTPARLDLDEIARYIATDDVDRAVSFVSELLDQCHALSDFPKAYPIIPRYKRQGVRRRVHGNYPIFYRVRSKQIDVLRILHGARDYERFLLPDK